jgi:type II secretory pathway component PulC
MLSVSALVLLASLSQLTGLVPDSSAPADLRLVGVVSSERAEYCVAILQSAGRTRVARPGEVAFGGEVQSVGVARVMMTFDGAPLELRLRDAVLPVLLVTPAPVDMEPRPVEARTTQLAPIRLQRADVDRRLRSEIPLILSQTQLNPVREGGEIVGFTIARLPSASLVSDAGLQTGDLLREINGVRLDSLATLIALWPKLQSATQLRVNVDRAGEPISLSITLE